MTKENKGENGKIEKLEEKINNLEKEKEEYLEGWKRARADFVNYKKAKDTEGLKLRKDEKKRLMKDILAILDTFYLAEEKIEDERKDDDYLVGLLSIRKQFEKFLEDEGVKRLKTVGKEFDPNLHEAVAMVESEESESDVIVEEVRKGYLIEGELLRPAKVKVSK